MTRVDLATFGARGLADAEERAAEYKCQLEGIVHARLKARFLEHIATFDPVARRLMVK